MKLTSSLLWSVLAFMSAAVIHASGEEVQPYAIPGRYIVVLKQGHRPADVAAKHRVKTHHVFGHALHGFAAEIPAEQLEMLRHDPSIDFIEPELELFSTGQTISRGINRIGANLSPMAKIDGNDIRINADIAILDTGIAPHPDLNIYTSVSFIAGQTTDGNGHGTHVAGIAAAIDNLDGVVGVAPGARLWAIKVMDNTGAGTTGSVIQGIDFVTQYAGQIEVANLSFGGIGYSAALRTAISNSVAKGVVFVVAAGNDSRDVYGPDGLQNTADDSIPASYPEVMTVSALSDLDGVPNAEDRLAGFSNYSRSVAGNSVTSPGAAIDLAAPGVNIFSTYLNGAYATMSGTSMASPHAAGAAALYIAAHSRATTAAGVYAIRQALINSAQPQSNWGSPNTFDPDVKHEGLVYVAYIAPPSGNNPPVVTITAPTATSFTSGTAISFAGSATDTEDLNRTASLVWRSNINGQIGTGASFTTTALSVGTHTITATATDTAGATGAKAITITVVSAPPPTQTLLVVVGTASTYVNRSIATITATVTAGGIPVFGAAAHMEVVSSKGNLVSSDTTTDASGKAYFQYTVNSSRGTGTYTVKVTASKPGVTSSFGTKTFTVTR